MSYNILRDHAVKNVWCTPDQDKRLIMKAARLTPINGAWNNFQIAWKRYRLPDTVSRFHIFQIGQLNPMMMGLFDAGDKWEKFSDCCIRQKMIVDIYSGNGIMLPRTETWYRVTENKNLVFAVKEQPKIPVDFNSHDIFFRVYSNAWFASIESDPTLDVVDVRGKLIGDTQDILDLQNAFNTASALPGHCYAFVNGYLRHEISLITAQVGDVCEYVRDSSIYKVIDLKVSDLHTFQSTLDSKFKYLIHYPDAGRSVIDYFDDQDFFVTLKTGNTVKGVYYHNNQPDAIRQLTHRDYSLPVPYVVGLAAQQAGWQTNPDWSIRIHLRYSGYTRPLVDENNRIKELYKLPDNLVVSAMVGVNALVSNWTADNLESSAYTNIMGNTIVGITKQKVEDAYGYNAISKILGDTPKHTRNMSSRKIIDVPYGLLDYSTAYEYDANGHLTEWHHHIHGYRYTAESNASLVEMVAGVGSTELDDLYGAQSAVLDPNYDYRMYTCPIVAGHPTNAWVDVTGTMAYGVVNNNLTWFTDPVNTYTLVRSNKNFLGYDLITSATDGLIRFSLDQIMTRDGATTTWVMQIPLGELDLFMNGKSLIEGLDFHLNFPEIVVINKSYLAQPPQTAQQRITVRFTGFCDDQLKHNRPTEKGFIYHKLLSENGRFDLRDDKVMRVIVDGSLYHKDELLFAEEDSGVSIQDADNGKPYMLRDIVVPLRNNSVTSTYPLRALSQVIDQRVSDYLTTRIPEPSFSTPNIITERYAVYSPFCCKLIYDLIQGTLNDPTLKQEYNDQDVYRICAPYEYLLKSDPTQANLAPDDRYVMIHPTNLNTVVNINLYHWKFMTRVVRLYLNDKVILSHFVNISL
jgi:hypothetical protein